MHISSKIMASGDDAKGHRVSVGALEGWKQVLCSCIVHVAFSQCSAYHMTRKKKEEKKRLFGYLKRQTLYPWAL